MGLKLLIILLVSHGKFTLGHSEVRDGFTNEDLDTTDASSEATDTAGDDHPGEPDSGEMMYDAVLETMSLVRQILDETKAQGLQLSKIQGQLQSHQDSGCSGKKDDSSFFAQFPWASLFSVFPGTPGYFPQQKRDRGSKVESRPQSPLNLRLGNLQRRKNPSEHRPVLLMNLRRAGPPLFPPETHPPPWIGYRSQHRQLDFGPHPNGPSNDPDLSMHNSQNPWPEGVYPPSGGYSEQKFPPVTGYRQQRRQLDFGPPPNGPSNDPDLSMHNSQNPWPEGVYPPSGGYSEQKFPPVTGYRQQRRQLDFGPPPNGPSNDPDLSMHNSQNPWPEGVYPPSGGYSEQQFPPGN